MSRLIRVRVGRPPGLPVDPPPAPPPPPESWQEAYDSDDMALIDSWYDSNTGIAGLGLVESELTTHTGNIESSEDGQTFENLDMSGGGIIITHDDVTIRGCVLRSTRRASTSNWRMLQMPTGKRFTIEYCDLTSDFEDANGFAYLKGASSATFRYLKFREDNFQSGIRLEHVAPGPVLIEYCNFYKVVTNGDRPTNVANHTWFGDQTNVTIRRNSMRGGGSAALTCYNRNDHQHYGNIIEENIINCSDRWFFDFEALWYSGSNGSVYIFTPDSSSSRSDTFNLMYNTVIRGNRFGRWGYPAGGQGHPSRSWDSRNEPGNIWEDNRMLAAPGWDGPLEVTGVGTTTYGDRQDWSLVDGIWVYTG